MGTRARSLGEPRETRRSHCAGVAALILLGCALGGGAACDSDKGGSPPPATRSEPPARPADQAPAAGGAPLTRETRPPEEVRALSEAFEAAAEAIRPSVVRLDVEGHLPGSEASQGPSELSDVPDFLRRFFEGPGQPVPTPRAVRGTGSGMVIDGAGHVLTNGHVLSGMNKVTIQLVDHRSFPGKVIGIDPLTDVGVVQFEKPPPGLVVARLGDSDSLRIGQWVIAVGSPLGMEQTVTAGIISGVGETGAGFKFQSGERVRKYIQTDAEINPGNSGGPLVELTGKVIGINTLINVGPGGSYGFAIPINQASQVAQILIKSGHIRYPFIGVSVVGLRELPEDLRAKAPQPLPERGALVAAVTPGGPAAEAGVRAGDVITKIAGHDVASGSDVVAAVSDRPIDSPAAIELVRDGKARTLEVKVGEYPTPQSQQGAPHERLGVAIQTLTPPIARELGLDPDLRGAVITDVEAGSPADRAGLAPGDVIREIDRQPVTSAGEAARALGTGKPAYLLRVTNARGTRYVSVSLR